MNTQLFTTSQISGLAVCLLTCLFIDSASFAATQATKTNQEETKQEGKKQKATQEVAEVQLEIKPLAERVHDYGIGCLILNDLDVVKKDIGRMSTDLGFGAIPDMFVTLPEDNGLAMKGGAILYGNNFLPDVTVQMEYFDGEKLSDALELLPGTIVDGEWMEVRDAKNLPVYDIFMNQVESALTKGSEIFFCPDDTRDEAIEIRDSDLLFESLDEESKSIINQSGITILGHRRDYDLASEADVESILKDAAVQLTESELEWVTKLFEAAADTDFGLFGIKYHDAKMLELRAHLQLGDDGSFEKLFNQPKLERDWKPGLGLEADRILGAASFQLDAFASSAAPRVVPQLLIREASRNSDVEFLQGNMLKVLIELFGDSWNDLDAARIAVYMNENAEREGQIAVIGVVDSRDPAVVIKELHRLASLTSPMMIEERATQREEEIAQLIEELASDDANIADRAETRLRLTGPIAEQALIELKSGESDSSVKTRADRILGYYSEHKKQSERESDVADPWFWTTLEPGMDFTEQTGTIAGMTMHSIEISPDPSKPDDQVAKAAGMMATIFGPNWNLVQVVQVRNHFVFSLGSNPALLEKTVQNVDKSLSPMHETLVGAGDDSMRGQMQVYFDVVRVMDFLREYSYWRGPYENAYQDERASWAAIDFSSKGASIKALIPIEQVIPFFSR